MSRGQIDWGRYESVSDLQWFPVFHQKPELDGTQGSARTRYRSIGTGCQQTKRDIPSSWLVPVSSIAVFRSQRAAVCDHRMIIQPYNAHRPTNARRIHLSSPEAETSVEIGDRRAQ